MGVVGRIGFDAKKFMSLLNQKKTFLLAVCANFIVQLGITYWTMMNYPSTKMGVGWFWFYILVQVALIFVLMRRIIVNSFWDPVVKFLLFSLFSFIWGIIFSSYRENKLYNGLIQFAVLGTASIFVAMFIVGLLLVLFGVSLGVSLGIGFGAGLFFGLLFLIIMQLVGLFAGLHMKWLNAVGLVLFALYIVYDTNTILARDYRGDFIQASMDYYLDSVNIFLDVLNLSTN
jgi:FtsH-binding integral membrane protein